MCLPDRGRESPATKLGTGKPPTGGGEPARPGWVLLGQGGTGSFGEGSAHRWQLPPSPENNPKRHLTCF